MTRPLSRGVFFSILFLLARPLIAANRGSGHAPELITRREVVQVPKEKNPKAERARDLYLAGKKLVEIAKELGVPEGTVRRWKSTYGWGKKQKTNVRVKTSVRNEEETEDVRSVLDDPELGEKWRLFILYYARTFNAVRSYQKAFPGSSYATAATESCKALKKPKIRDAIMELKRQRCAKAYLEADDIFQKYMDIAFADMTDFAEFNKYGVSLRPSDEVDGTLVTEVKEGRDGVTIKLADRMKALQWLTDHMDMATAEQKAKIDNLKASTAKLRGEDPEGDGQDDGFMAAMKGEAEGAWQE